MVDSHPFFDPFHLRPLASLNRRAVSLLAGIKTEYVGKTGAELLTKRALIELVETYRAALGLEGIHPEQYALHVNALLEQVDTPGYPAAAGVAQEYGKRLGYLLASLFLAPTELTSPLDAWEAQYLRYWQETVRSIWLGGGHASGKFGAVACQAAKRTLEQLGLGARTVQVTLEPGFLPLIGAARVNFSSAQTAVVADFGSSRAKRGVALYNDQGQLAKLIVFAPEDITGLISQEDPAELAEGMVWLISDTVRRAGRAALSTQVIVSVAAYVENGQPLNINRGAYTSLNQLAPDLKAWFSERITHESQRPVRISFAHDADIAARALAGKERAALVMLGSGMGVGFVPPDENLREMTEGFCVER